MSKIKLFTGPRLERHRWACDASVARGGWQSEDITNRAHEFLFEEVELAPDVTLSDIFTLISDNPILQDVYRQEFVAELCEEAKKGATPAVEKNWERIEYLELYQIWALNSTIQEYARVGRFNLHGVGIIQEADIFEHGLLAHKKDERITWGVSMTPVRQLLLLPVRVCAEVLICEDDVDSRNFGQTIRKGTNIEITLGSLIRDTLWELSVHGSPETSAKVREDLLEQVEALEQGALETVSFETVFEGLGLTPHQDVYAKFFESCDGASAQELYRALSALEDLMPVQAGLLEELSAGVVVKPEFAALTSREFRKLIRLSQHEDR